MDPRHQNEIQDLPVLTNLAYENIFHVYEENGFYFYNLLSKVNFPADLDPSTYEEYLSVTHDTWHYISYKLYGTIELWWLVCAVNQIDNPLELPIPGTRIKALKGNVVSEVIRTISEP
jgi:hypothetical protein